MKPRKHCYANGGQVKDYPVRGSSSPNSPGFTGAVKDAVKAVGNYVGSKSTDVSKGKGGVKARSLRQKQMDDLGI